jgi:hypothetical protein
MFAWVFWRQVLERAIKTAAQFGVGAWGTVAFTKVGEVVSAGQAVGLAMVFGAGASVLTSLASYSVGEKGSPSLLPKEKSNARNRRSTDGPAHAAL